jgi:hypothetical protein
MSSILVSLAAVLVVAIGHAAAPSPATYSYSVFDSHSVKYQNPVFTACTGANTLSMLNMIYRFEHRPGFAPSAVQAAQPKLIWHPSTSGVRQQQVYYWIRTHMDQPFAKEGADPHGWRNALNYFGWGSIKAGVYSDQAYATFDAAARAVVVELARSNEPIGIVTWYGSHAQFVTGYVVEGSDPRTGSKDFTVKGVYLTDPAREKNHTNFFVSYGVWKSGDMSVRFTQYRQSDSVFRDAIDGQIGKREWREKYVIVGPVLT